jgi:hypothetical protein
MAKASNVILVHGAWADGSSWSKIIPLCVDQNVRRRPLRSIPVRHQDCRFGPMSPKCWEGETGFSPRPFC